MPAVTSARVEPTRSNVGSAASAGGSSSSAVAIKSQPRSNTQSTTLNTVRGWFGKQLSRKSNAGCRKYSLEQSLERSVMDHRCSVTDLNTSGQLPGRDQKKRVSLGVNPLDNITAVLDIAQHWMMFRPTSMKRLAWDMIMMVMVVYVALIAPYRIGFGVDATNGWLVWETVVDFLFMADVLINFRTGFYLEDEVRQG